MEFHQEFLKRFTTFFVHMGLLDLTKADCYTIPKVDCHLYEVKEINGKMLPAAKLLEASKLRSWSLVELIRNILQDQYAQEKGVVKKEIIDKKQELPKVIKSYRKESKKLITSPFIAAQCCVDLFMQLNAQPTSESDICSKNSKYKVLPLNNTSDRRIFEIICSNALKKNKAYGELRVWSFSNRPGADGKNIKEGITLALYVGDKLHDVCKEASVPNDGFKKACDEVVVDLVTGWKSTSLIENQDIPHDESEQEWTVLIKPHQMMEEDVLIRFFSSVANLQHLITCDLFRGNSMLYLWIKKKSYDLVIEKLGSKVDVANI